MIIVERDVDSVVADLGRQIRHVTGAITVVSTVDGRLARTFNGDAQSTLTRSPSIDHKLRRPVYDSLHQPGTAGLNLARVRTHETLQPEGLWSYRSTAETYTQQVLAQLGRSEVHQETLRRGNHMRLDAIAGRTGNGDSEIGLPDPVRNHPELL